MKSCKGKCWISYLTSTQKIIYFYDKDKCNTTTKLHYKLNQTYNWTHKLVNCLILVKIFRYERVGTKKILYLTEEGKEIKKHIDIFATIEKRLCKRCNRYEKEK